MGNDMIFRSLMTSHNPHLDIYNADAVHALPDPLPDRADAANWPALRQIFR